jgi:hypothetical protein
VTFHHRIKILIGAAMVAGLLGGFFGATTFMGNDDNSAARGDSAEIPFDNSAEIDIDGDDDATEIPFDNSAEIDVDGDEPGTDAVGETDGGDVAAGAEGPGEDAVGDPDGDDVDGGEPAQDPVDQPGKCDLDPEAEGCEPETPFDLDLDIVNPEDDTPDPPFPGNGLDIEAQPEDDDDPDPFPHPDFHIKTEIQPTH